MSDTDHDMAIEVVYALAHRQEIRRLRVAPGTTAAQAVAASGLTALYPEIDPASSKLGIFGKACRPDMVLREHDRVEIYRPLIADPKEMRRLRAAQGRGRKAAGKGAGTGA